jgi:hypothetical protein
MPRMNLGVGQERTLLLNVVSQKLISNELLEFLRIAQSEVAFEGAKWKLRSLHV